MCGIAGLLSTTTRLDPTLISQMMGTLRHRGPDDEGYLAVNTKNPAYPVEHLIGLDSAIQSHASILNYSGPASLYLGHRRLSILDLSSMGHQPMSYGEDSWIVFNGEIYNYLELKSELISYGYEFHTGTDTEVILASYAHWGEDCVSRFNGDWAFCIFDRRQRKLFLSRDRYGVKPLYFFQKNGDFAFASEIKALLDLPFIQRKLNLTKAFEYYVLHCRDHSDQTLFEDIFQVLPGQNWVIDIPTGKPSIYRYYSLSFCQDLGEYDNKKALAYVDDVRELLFDAVRLRLRADVEVGTCLSGGLDSSAIVAVAAKLRGVSDSRTALHTFTASFPGKPEDEKRFARIAADHSKVFSHYVYPTAQGYESSLTKLLYHLDEPFGSSTVYSQWEVLREASQYVKVVLDGQGGDEVFGGYLHNKASFISDLFLDGRVREFARELGLTSEYGGNLTQTLHVLKTIPFFLLNPKLQNFLFSFLNRKQISAFKKAFGEIGISGQEQIENFFSPRANEQLWNYMTQTSLPYLLRAEDRNSMAFSIEARVPFTDYRLVDYVFSLPAVYKIHNGWTKWLLRLAVQDLLPPDITWRKDKKGFSTPSWIPRDKEWSLWLQESFPEPITI